MNQRLLPAILLLGSLPAFAAGFHPLSLPGSQLAAMSADGLSAAGGVVDGASGGFRWHAGTPPQFLPGAVSVRAISASGRLVVGSSLDAEQREVATWWDADGIAHPLGGLPHADAMAGVLSVGYGITDQPLVVGTATGAGHASSAFAWTAVDGMRALTTPEMASGAVGVGRDGHRIFGWSAQTGATRRGVLWNDERSIHAITDTRAAKDELIGADGSATLLLGITSDDAGGESPYRWIPDTRAMQVSAIPTLSPRTRFTASSDDGRVLAGAAGSGGQRVAAIWTEGGGVERLDDFLAARAISVPRGWTLIATTAVSADGRHLGGFGLKDGRFDSFVIDLPPMPDDASQSTTAP